MKHEPLIHEAFTTTRDELFERFILQTPSGFVVTGGEYGPGRSYYKTVGDLLDVLYAFCDEKEAAGLPTGDSVPGGSA